MLDTIVENPIVETDGVFHLKGQDLFGYSDGVRVEEYVLNAIKRSTDISSSSRELERFIKDWSTRYHFSRERAVPYHSLRLASDATVLEVGCGCGSITRAVGERVKDVTALEGSPRRARITRLRTRDLESVKVLCASFEDVRFTRQFDIVICNGVLEYASLFISHPEPHGQMLKQLSLLVKPGGVLILAIENQLGLRYFSSGTEEHTGIMFDGLEGYPRRPRGPRTFGASELRSLVGEYFAKAEMLYPLPDYKLPTAIIREQLLEKVSCAELFASTARFDFGCSVKPLMHERLVWHELERNGQLGEFANSFFILAGDNPSAMFDEGWLGDIYSMRRRPGFMVRTRILSSDHNDRGCTVTAEKSYLAFEALPAEDLPFVHRTEQSPWLSGKSIHTAIVEELCRKGSIPVDERLKEPVGLWWDAIGAETRSGEDIPGQFLDCNWDNALIDRGNVVLIDREWVWRTNIPACWLVYRVVTKFVNSEIPFAHRWNRAYRRLTPYQLMRVVAHIGGRSITIRQLVSAIRLEERLQDAVGQKPGSPLKVFSKIFEPVIVQQLRQRTVLRVRATRQRAVRYAERVFSRA